VHVLLFWVGGYLHTFSDCFAEGVAQLAGVARGTTQTVGDATALPAYTTDIRKVADHVGALVERYAALAKSVREAIDIADDAGDAGTADIFTSFSRDVDKDLWFLKSHLE
jgi:starvation-inducible DNA-binding protein